MTTWETYNEDLPCKNPNCKSHGQPHPNCKCYGGGAAGGEVKPFCQSDNKHDESCEYYFEGGQVDDDLHKDPHHSVASYLANEGLHSLINMKADPNGNALEKYNASVKKGSKHFEQKIEHLFIGKPFEHRDHTKASKQIHDWMAKGGIIQDLHDEMHEDPTQNFAEGGAVKKESKLLHDHPIANRHPEQNLMLQAAKGRMANYLNTLRPHENVPKLAFDRKPDDTQQKKSYQKALKIAAHPLSVLEEIQKGTLQPEEIVHLKNLHPEVDNVLQQKLTERIIKDQLDNKKPSYKVRQGLSLLLGAPLSSEMTPQNLQAIQATFQLQKAQNQQQVQAQGKTKKGTSSLNKVSQHYLTQDDALTSRSQKQ